MIFALTMQAVSNIHSRHILHNDFNDNNLLFDDYLNPVCIDFGFGRPFHIAGEQGLEILTFTQTGTHYYASHEALCSRMPGGILQGFTSTKGDVYAVTAVLFHIIFCKDTLRPLAFDRGNPPIYWEQRLSLVYECLQPLNTMRFVLSLYRQCLQFDPLMRPSAATAVQNARQFAKIFLPPDASWALDQVLDGSLKHYPWDLLRILDP